MEKSIIDIINKKIKELPEKELFVDNKRRVTYKEFAENSQKIGTYINQNIKETNLPILIFIDKTVNCLEAMMGILYSGNFSLFKLYE